MGFFTDLISASVKVVLTPVAVVKDVVNIATNEDVDATKSLLESAVEDIQQAFDDVGDGEIL